MQAEEIQEYCLKKKGVTESFPFNEETLVFKVGNKIFLLMSLESQPLKISLKNTPEKNIELRAEFWQIEGAYHMNKAHWSSVVCEGIKADLIKKLIDESYDLVFKSLTKKMRDEVLAI
ncbi:Predicted DNA-binding protein, MmcQ/YjbR family [Halpernia humi]|uniref:Predicted DNA-binding protein, MmcQ/YjbR family n=1 Tax=Halpernia humi TaxID=493375 RepID=A0A1H6AUC2_9FLAO|nr:MmcQ/YjbR family DNA-binding protein [Halpernia humi]SEG51466.1 Predicted DNA-binding protein, MmcQ/YjbR family [Halpernia humi]